MIPIESVVVPVIDFVIAFCVLVGLFAWYGRAPHWHTVLTPVFLGMALLTAFGVGLWLSALNVRFRDIPYVVPLVTQLWLYASPVIYGATFIPPQWRWLVALNPMTGVLYGIEDARIGPTPAPVRSYFLVTIDKATGVATRIGAALEGADRLGSRGGGFVLGRDDAAEHLDVIVAQRAAAG